MKVVGLMRMLMDFVDIEIDKLVLENYDLLVRIKVIFINLVDIK